MLKLNSIIKSYIKIDIEIVLVKVLIRGKKEELYHYHCPHSSLLKCHPLDVFSHTLSKHTIHSFWQLLGKMDSMHQH
jgi:hypothetical protein